MRRALLLALSLVLLLAALVLAWNQRYEPIPGSEIVTLDSLKSQTSGQKGMQWRVADGKPILQLIKAAGDPHVILEFSLPAPAGCTAIHLRYTLQAHNLKQGVNIWDDGRFNVAWMTKDKRQAQQVDSVRHDAQASCPSLISVAPNGGVEPQLWICHLGVSGVYEIHELEIVFVHEKAWWGIVSGTLIALAGGWILIALLIITQVSIPRTFAASIITLMLVHRFVVPGPWMFQKSLFADSFDLGSIRHHTAPKFIADPKEPIRVPDAVVEGKTTPPLSNNQFSPPPTVQRTTVIQDNWILWIKYELKRFKIIPHSLLFGAVLLALAGLIGLRPAVYVSVFLALSTEAAQIAFRYGSDATDLLDLVYDATGIAAGVWLVMLLRRRRWSLLKMKRFEPRMDTDVHG